MTNLLQTCKGAQDLFVGWVEFQEECLLLANLDVPEQIRQDTPTQKLVSRLIKVKANRTGKPIQ
jgi:hypothetical protein